MKLVAHRGGTRRAAENTLDAFRIALELGADAVELDVRLSADGVPVVHHYAYLEPGTDGRGPVWQHSVAELRELHITGYDDARIPRLDEVLDEFADARLGLEIELKGPEPECVSVVGGLLQSLRCAGDRIEVTSYEPALLAAIGDLCRGINTALLFPRSESWMGPDVVAHHALHRARQAHASAVHLHPTQLSEEIVSYVRAGRVEVHAWDVNDVDAFNLAAKLELPFVCTDELEHAFRWRSTVAPDSSS
jgi:glycerophosphoryl diester phosphodiesterase